MQTAGSCQSQRVVAGVLSAKERKTLTLLGLAAQHLKLKIHTVSDRLLEELKLKVAGTLLGKQLRLVLSLLPGAISQFCDQTRLLQLVYVHRLVRRTPAKRVATAPSVSETFNEEQHLKSPTHDQLVEDRIADCESFFDLSRPTLN